MTDITAGPADTVETRDLTQIGTGAAAETLRSPGPGFAAEPYNLVKDRENVRGRIAMWLVWTLVGLIVLVSLIALGTQIACSLNGAACPTPTTELVSVRALIELILTPLVGLVGAVTGFYFGEKSANATP